MAIIPHFNGPTTWLTSLINQPLFIFLRRQRTHLVQTSFSSSSSSFSFSFSSSSSLLCSLLMASSSRRSTRGRRGTFSGEGGSSVASKAAASRGSEDHSDSSSSDLRSPKTLGDILGQPTIDPWYKSGERFPSVSASLQPPPADWE
jgi:hypothetical protein